MLSRTASRDLFDTNLLTQLKNIDKNKSRLGLVIYGAINPKDWSTVNIDSISFDAREIKEKLLPVLRANQVEAQHLSKWGNQLVKQSHEFLAPFFQLEANELEFIKKIRTESLIEPQLMIDDPKLTFNIKNHPALLWRSLKAQSIR